MQAARDHPPPKDCPHFRQFSRKPRLTSGKAWQFYNIMRKTPISVRFLLAEDQAWAHGFWELGNQ
jgi:hypothetical protein